MRISISCVTMACFAQQAVHLQSDMDLFVYSLLDGESARVRCFSSSCDMTRQQS